MTGVGFAHPNRNGLNRIEITVISPPIGSKCADRVEGQAPEQLRRGVTQQVRGGGVGELVHGERDQQEDRDHDEVDGLDVEQGQSSLAWCLGTRVWYRARA